MDWKEARSDPYGFVHVPLPRTLFSLAKTFIFQGLVKASLTSIGGRINIFSSTNILPVAHIAAIIY